MKMPDAKTGAVTLRRIQSEGFRFESWDRQSSFAIVRFPSLALGMVKVRH